VVGGPGGGVGGGGVVCVRKGRETLTHREALKTDSRKRATRKGRRVHRQGVTVGSVGKKKRGKKKVGISSRTTKKDGGTGCQQRREGDADDRRYVKKRGGGGGVNTLDSPGAVQRKGGEGKRHQRNKKMT